MREFPLAEIEFFVDPLKKDHPKFKTVADLELPLYTGDDQEHGRPLKPMRLGDAVANGVVANETLGHNLI